uniref:Surface protein amastin, putative n=1 Tax=Leishmania guyanensis TaxID=5670 RepID=A0A1E1J1M7_LEIGU|nr:surface protein amastin, putative [Leishmania guyanensis]
MGFEALHGRMDVALNMLCSCTVFMFLVTSAPISQFRGSGIRTDGSGGASKLASVTSWGLKNDCNNNHYDYRSTSITCARSRQLFQVAQAFYIIAVIVSFLSSLLSGLYFIGIKAKVALIVLGFLEVVVALIPWVCMTAVWHNDYCGQSTVMINASSGKANGVPYGSVLRTAFKMSAGYGMTVTAWCVQVVGLTLLLTM